MRSCSEQRSACRCGCYRRRMTQRSISAPTHTTMSAGTVAASVRLAPSSAGPIAKISNASRPAPQTKAGFGKSSIERPLDRAHKPNNTRRGRSSTDRRMPPHGRVLASRPLIKLKGGSGSSSTDGSAGQPATTCGGAPGAEARRLCRSCGACTHCHQLLAPRPAGPICDRR
jgi:hypothetical protein